MIIPVKDKSEFVQFPIHVAFIMDGNRRWARSHKVELFFGHDKGARNIEPLVEFAAKQGIRYVTFWAFSTENWKRTEEEVEEILAVFRKALQDPMIDRLQKNGVCVRAIGDITAFPQDIRERIVEIVDESKHNTRITATFALNYGGRNEILNAVKAFCHENDKTQVSEETFSQYLYTKDIPDPDLLIRTGGEMRLSGFMPWQTVYTELYFTNVLWPDFGQDEFEKALKDFAFRQRRFGK
jgi:undecaprenyl diphosphate synthase